MEQHCALKSQSDLVTLRAPRDPPAGKERDEGNRRREGEGMTVGDTEVAGRTGGTAR